MRFTMLVLYSRALLQFSLVAAQEYAKVTSTFYGAISFFCADALPEVCYVFREKCRGHLCTATCKLACTTARNGSERNVKNAECNKESARRNPAVRSTPRCSNRRNAFAQILENCLSARRYGPQGPISSRVPQCRSRRRWPDTPARIVRTMQLVASKLQIAKRYLLSPSLCLGTLPELQWCMYATANRCLSFCSTVRCLWKDVAEFPDRICRTAYYCRPICSAQIDILINGYTKISCPLPISRGKSTNFRYEIKNREMKNVISQYIFK